MAIKTRDQLKAENASDFPNNTTRLISPANLRGQMDDVADSALLSEDIAGLDLSEAHVTAVGDGTQTLAEWTSSILSGEAGDFSPSWTGAITWPVTQRMQEQIYLLDFIPVEQHQYIRTGASLPAAGRPSGIAASPLGTYDCSDAFEAAMAAVSVPHQSAPSLGYVGAGEIILPMGHCYFDRTIELNKTVTLRGYGCGDANGYSSRIVFKAGITGIVINYIDTIGGTVVEPTPGAVGSVLRDFRIGSLSGGAPFTGLAGQPRDDIGLGYDYGAAATGGYATDHWIGHGIWVRAMCKIECLLVQNFPRCGVYAMASSVGTTKTIRPWMYGNFNFLRIDDLGATNNGASGVYIDGADANACTFTALNVSSNRLSGVYDSCLITNTHIGHHSDSNNQDGTCSYISGGLSRRYLTINEEGAMGDAPAWLPNTLYMQRQVVENVGNLYYQTNTATTSGTSGPTGTGTDIVDGGCRWDFFETAGTKVPPAGHANSGLVWNFIQNSPSGAAPDPHADFPPFPDTAIGSGIPKRYRRGHPYWVGQASSGNVLIGVYTEASVISAVLGNAIVIGGAINFSSDSTATFLKGGGNFGKKLLMASPDGSYVDFTTWINNVTDESLRWSAAGDHASGLAFLIDNSTEGNWAFQHARTSTPLRFTTSLNTLTGGRSAVIPGGNVAFARGMWLGNTTSTLRHVSAATVMPTTGEWAAGDLMLNSAPLLGEPWGWRCIAGGTPGTWQPLRDLGSQQTITTNLAITLTPGTSPYHTLYSGAIIADRTATLSKTGALVGLSYKIARTATGAFNLNVLNGAAGPTLKALAVNTWGEFAFDGTDYYLAAYGSL